MKLKTNLGPRRDGLLPKIELGASVRGGKHETYTADADGEYDVPDSVAPGLIATGNFYPADGSVVELEPPESNIITDDDGEPVNLDEMSRADLSDLAINEFDIKVKANDNKAVITAAIMAAVRG